MTDQIFISYSKKDSDFAHRLAGDLEAAGFITWLDRQSIRGGKEWRKAIEEGLISADAVVVVLSNSAIESPWVNHEGSLAVGREKHIIPVRIS